MRRSTPRTPKKPVAHEGQDPLLTLKQAATWLNTSETTVRRMIARGDLQAYRFGPRLIRVDPSDLIALATAVTPMASLRQSDRA